MLLGAVYVLNWCDAFSGYPRGSDKSCPSHCSLDSTAVGLFVCLTGDFALARLLVILHRTRRKNRSRDDDVGGGGGVGGGGAGFCNVAAGSADGRPNPTSHRRARRRWGCGGRAAASRASKEMEKNRQRKDEQSALYAHAETTHDEASLRLVRGLRLFVRIAWSSFADNRRVCVPPPCAFRVLRCNVILVFTKFPCDL